LTQTHDRRPGTHHAEKVVPSRTVTDTLLADDSREAIVSGVRGLNDWLAREYDTMIDAVTRSAGLAAKNLVAGESNVSEKALAQEQSTLVDFASIVEQLDGRQE
jgi:hypothetical protein